MKTSLQDRLTAPQRDRVAPDTRPMTGSITNKQPSTIRGEAEEDADVPFGRDHGIDGVGIWGSHSVVQFGAAITSTRDRLARRRVRWLLAKLEHLPPSRGATGAREEQAVGCRGGSTAPSWRR